MSTVNDDRLRRDVRWLGDQLGEVIRDSLGEESLELVESLRQLSRRRRQGDHAAESELADRISRLSLAETRIVARAFGVFLDLANMAEDRHRIRVLRARTEAAFPDPMGETIAGAIRQLKASGFSAEQVQAALQAVQVELVFTAHPSEAKRRSIRAKLRRMRRALQDMDRLDLLPRERESLQTRIRADLLVLWQTDFLRPSQPTVLEEVERGLSITPRLVEVIPQVYESLRRALQQYYPDATFDIPLFLRFGSWMGGDRDGNPHVTSGITQQTIHWLRETIIGQHLAICKRMYDFLSVSTREVSVNDALQEQLAARQRSWPELATALSAVAPLEVYRQWIRMIEWRLKQSLPVSADAPIALGHYRDGAELSADLTIIYDSLVSHRGSLLANTEIVRWMDLSRVFGLHLARLDVRQDSRRYREIMADVLAAFALCPDFDDLSEADRCDILSQPVNYRELTLARELQPLTSDTLNMFRVLYNAIRTYGPDCIGGHVISLTKTASDVLSVLWLWRWAQAQAGDTDPASTQELRIIPLFEKIDDLRNAASTLDTILSHPLYRQHVARLGNRQIIMVGYSDSTKDGGYMAACWGLYQAQSRLQAVAERHGVALTFFHGRGGSLGRGGGPAARGILSLPPEACDGTLRLTEQGEVLAERYDDTQIAFRHLEQVAWATLTATALPKSEVPAAWRELAESLALRAYQAYRGLVEQPGFIQFFAEATPIDEIENLPIGSRPARRRGERSLGDLRAIPWVFAWTQNRCLIPAWYGLGTALTDVKYRDRNQWKMVCEMYRSWPFMQATIDNAVLAVAKSDMVIAHHYVDLIEDADVRQRCWSLIAAERDRTRQALLDVVGGAELLANSPWFLASIEARNPYIDPLNLIQIELLKRRRNLPADATDVEREQLRDMLRLSVQGLAAGMRTTG